MVWVRALLLIFGKADSVRTVLCFKVFRATIKAPLHIDYDGCLYLSMVSPTGF